MRLPMPLRLALISAACSGGDLPAQAPSPDISCGEEACEVIGCAQLCSSTR